MTHPATREDLLNLVADIRPALHRYCARLTGSVLDGEDIVQEAITRAFHALGAEQELPPLRPWLFKIAHNAAVDLLKSHGRSRTELHDDITLAADAAQAEAPADPAVVRAAIARFLVLPLSQRSAVILKDVLGHSLEETAEIMEATVMAVKAALVRGRGRLLELAADPSPSAAVEREQLHRYATLFNHKDWDGLRAMLAADVHLDLVAKAERRGAAVGQYFGRYALESVTLQPGWLEGRPALAAHVAGDPRPAYFVLLGWDGDQVATIRDYRYVPYIADDAVFVPEGPLPSA
jgi:RNA polymerase sigma factor (sigma-70 family)